MASVDDNDELIATRRLNGLDDGLYESDKNVANMTEEAFNEIIDNFEVVAHLTMYGRKGIKENVKKLQARIKELDADLTTAYLKGYADAEEKYREKIKEKRDEINKKYEDSKDENGESPYYYPEYTIKVLEKLLEEK